MADYSETIEVHDTKICIYIKLNEYIKYTCTSGQDHSLIFVQGNSEWNWISGERYRNIGPLVNVSDERIIFYSKYLYVLLPKHFSFGNLNQLFRKFITFILAPSDKAANNVVVVWHKYLKTGTW